MAASSFSFHPVDQDRWTDFEKLFESKGGPSNCWCMAWRATGEETKHSDKATRKNDMHQRVKQQIPIGLLAYSDEEPVAWCSIAPRSSYRPLGGEESDENVWSLVCFYVKKGFRKQGLTKTLLEEAIQFAKRNGADAVEAYPVDPDSPSYRYMGFRHPFEKAGFEYVKKAGQRRNVMRLAISKAKAQSKVRQGS